MHRSKFSSTIRVRIEARRAGHPSQFTKGRKGAITGSYQDLDSTGLLIEGTGYIAAVEHLGHDVADVAVFLRKHPGSVSRWLETPTGTGHDPGLVQHLLELLAADFDVVSAGM